jgi:hypothetical protein
VSNVSPDYECPILHVSIPETSRETNTRKILLFGLPGTALDALFDCLTYVGVLPFRMVSRDARLWARMLMHELGPRFDVTIIMGLEEAIEDGPEEQYQQEATSTSSVSFASWKDERARLLAEQDSSTTKEGDEVPQGRATVESTARHLGVSAADLSQMFEIPGGLHDGVRHLEALSSVRVAWHKPPDRTPLPRQPGDDCSMQLFPPLPCIPTTDPMPPHTAPTVFPDGRSSWHISEVVLDADKLRQLGPWLAAVEKDMERARHLSEGGHHSRPSGLAARPFIIEAAQCDQRIVNMSIDISATGQCTPRDDSDRPTGRFDMTKWPDVMNKSFPDQELLSWREFGVDLKTTAPWAIVLCPPMISARPHLQELSDAAAKEIKKGWLQEEKTLVVCAPMSANSYGMNIKHDRPPYPKKRETTNMSSPGDLCDAEGRPLAVNPGIDLGSFAGTTLPTVATFRTAAAIIHDGYCIICEAHPELAEDLCPTGIKGDGRAYFRQFPVRRKCTARQMKFDKPKDGPLRLVSSLALQFGSRSGPTITQRFTNVGDVQISRLFGQWDRRVQKIATEGRGPGLNLALRLAPPAYCDWMLRRAAALGGAQATSYFNRGYIDDEMAQLLGRMRGVFMFVVYFDVMDESELPYALDKLELGDGVVNLGIQFFLREGFTCPSGDKLQLILEWTDRIIQLERVERCELISLAGFLAFSSFSVLHGKLLLRPLYRAAHQKLHGSAPKKYDRLCLGPTAAACLRRIGEELRVSGGLAPFHAGNGWEEGTEFEAQGWTDANREDDPAAYSGMGGFCPETRIVWFYRLSERQRSCLPIHITEDVAEIVQLCLNAPFLSKKRYLGHIDNQASLASIRSTHGVRDHRMNEVALVRKHLMDHHDILAMSDFVPSDDNISDAISRGDFPRFIREAGEKGFSEFTWIDVRQSGAPVDLEQLMEHLISART